MAIPISSSGLRFKATFDMSETYLLMQDTTNYATFGLSSDTIKVLFKVTGPDGIFYQNPGYAASDFSNPDISELGSASKILSDIQLPVDIYGAVSEGYYKFEMKVMVNSGPTVYSTSKEISGFTYSIPIGTCSLVAEESISKLTVTDTTDYTATINGIAVEPGTSSREFNLQHPVMADQTLTNTLAQTNQLIVGPSIYSGPYVLGIETEVYYDVELWGDNYWLVVSDTIRSSGHIDVPYDDCVCNYYNCYVSLNTDYEIAKTRGNRAEMDRISGMLLSLNTSWILWNMAKKCGQDTSAHCARIQAIVSLANCNCTVTASTEPREIVPWANISVVGGGTGTSWHLVDTPIPSNTLGENGDFALCSDWSVWHKESGAYVLVGNIKGDTGVGSPGSPGADGSTILNGTGVPDNGDGSDDDYYIDTANGNLYQKQSGSWVLLFSMVGEQGPSIDVHFDTSAPTGGTGVDGDLFINTNNGDLYKKESGSWVLKGNIKGPTGTGAPGAAGEDGSTILYGTGVPASLLGNDDDYYIDTATGYLYQKQSGSWVFVVSLKGPEGPMGIIAAICLFNGWPMLGSAAGILAQVLSFFSMDADTINATDILQIDAVFELSTTNSNNKNLMLHFAGTQITSHLVTGAVTADDKMVKLSCEFHRSSTNGAHWNFVVYRSGSPAGSVVDFGAGQSTENFEIANLITASAQMGATAAIDDVICHTLTVKHWKTVQY